MKKLWNDFSDWNFETFGHEPRVQASIDHLKEEIEELANDPYDIEEAVDVFMLTISVVIRTGYSYEDFIEAFRKKFRKNKARTWHKVEAGYSKGSKV